MKLLTKDYYRWTNRRYCIATNPETGVETKLIGYKGTTKLLNFGEPTFEEKLIAKMGPEKAAETLARVRARGNKAHSQLENDKTKLVNTKVLTELGTNLGDEVLVYGNILGANIIGFIDAVYRLPSGQLCLVDWKTKKNRSSFKYYDEMGSVESYYRQLVTYAALFKALYGETISETRVIMIYADKPLINDVYTLSQAQFPRTARYLADKVKLYLKSKT